MREFTAMTQSKKGGTEAVIVRATDSDDAKKRLLDAGYFAVLWFL